MENNHPEIAGPNARPPACRSAQYSLGLRVLTLATRLMALAGRHELWVVVKCRHGQNVRQAASCQMMIVLY